MAFPAIPPGTLAARKDWKHWVELLLIALALIVLWQVPWLGWLAYPFRLFGTFVHELSHGLAAIFFALSMIFVWRSFYGMRIGSGGLSA